MPSIITARLLAAPKRAGPRRHREALLAAPVGDDHRDAGVQRGAGVGVAGGRDAAAGADHVLLEARPQVEAAAVAADLPDAGALDPVEFADQRRPRRASAPRGRRLCSARSPSRRPPPAGRASAAGRSRRACARRCRRGRRARPGRPRSSASSTASSSIQTTSPSRVNIRYSTGRCLRLPSASWLSTSSARMRSSGWSRRAQSPGSARNSSAREAEDLLDLGADVAPAPVLAQLGGVDDHRQAVDQARVVLSAAAGDLEELADLVVRPVGVAALRHRGLIDRRRALA